MGVDYVIHVQVGVDYVIHVQIATTLLECI